jgi:hypothetical protein
MLSRYFLFKALLESMVAMPLYFGYPGNVHRPRIMKVMLEQYKYVFYTYLYKQCRYQHIQEDTCTRNSLAHYDTTRIDYKCAFAPHTHPNL